tara:strand:+ start:79545 stop:80369 length:825 start_codon:yes stop_codon:yes gene_type:complete
MMRIICLIILFPTALICQKPLADLSSDLAETSALILIGDEFYTINDSGNKPVIYLFDKKGQIIHECIVGNAENYDWEALAYDGQYIYIGDIGNNNNDRKNLKIYRVNKDSVRNSDRVLAESMSFNYEGQNAFPPEKQHLYFDAESLVCNNDSLFIFTKNRTEPFDGVSRVYSFRWKKDQSVEAKYLYDLNLNPTNWMEESITDAHLCGEDLFIMTYAKVYWFKWKGNSFQKEKTYLFKGFTQKEGLTLDKKHFYITDENESLLGSGNKLYKLKR